MSKNTRILYLKDEFSQNSKFIEYLKKEYKTDIYNYVLPSVYEEKIGHLFLDSVRKTANNKYWKAAIGRDVSRDDISFEYGFALPNVKDFSNSFVGLFKVVLSFILRSLNFEINQKVKVIDIISKIKSSTIFIKEEELKKYELIIIEQLATFIPRKSYYKSNTNRPYVYYNDKICPDYVKYKIAPSILNNLLKSKIKILHLIDYKDNIDSWTNNFLFSYSNTLENIGMSSICLGNYLPKDTIRSRNRSMVGVDYNNRIKNKPYEFAIISDNNYKQEIYNKYKIFFNNVSKIYVNFPIQITTNNNILHQDIESIFLRGNKETTKLYTFWEDEMLEKFKDYFPDGMKLFDILTKDLKLNKDILFKYLNSEKNKIDNDMLLEFLNIRYRRYEKDSPAYNYYNFEGGDIYTVDSATIYELYPKDPYKVYSKYCDFKSALEIVYRIIYSETIFGMANISELRSSITMGGNICCDEYFEDDKTGNQIFIKNVIKFLIELINNNPVTEVEFLPQIKIDISLGELFVNDIKIKLKKIEFCYYLFFAERAKNKDNFFTVLDNTKSDFNFFLDEFNEKHKLEGRISPLLIHKIICYYEISFPDNNSIKRLKDIYKKKETPLFTQTFLTYFSRINKELTLSLARALPENQLSQVTISRQGNNKLAKYGISLPSANIEIIS